MDTDTDMNRSTEIDKDTGFGLLHRKNWLNGRGGHRYVEV
jgi:hypothetical protein